MKSLALIYLMFFTVGSSFAQGVRTFYQSYSDNTFSNSMFEYNDEVYFVSIKDSSSSMLKIVCGKLDDQLNTSNYRYQYVIKESVGIHQLSGCAVNGNFLTLAILRNVSSQQSRLTYITIDLTSFMVVSRINEQLFLRSGFVESISKDGHLITYLHDSSNKIYRYDNDILSFSYANSEYVDSLSLPNNINSRKINIEIFNGIEFVTVNLFTKLKIYKRMNEGVYSNKIITPLIISGTFDFTIMSNGNLLASNVNSYSVLNQDLDSISSGEYNVMLGWPGQNSLRSKLFSLNNLNILLRDNGKKYQFDLDMNLIDSMNYNRNLSIEGVFKTDNDFFVFGQLENPTKIYTPNDNFQNDNTTDIFIIKNNSNEDFTEFGRDFKHHSITFNSGSCGTAFIDGVNGGSAYTYQVDDKQIGLIFMKKNQVIGKMNQNQLSGLSGTYTNYNYVLPGPVTSSMADRNENIDNYNRGYYVTKQMIEDHLTILFYGNPSYVPPHGIREWPAHGNVSNGEPENIASFVDVNNNGIYEPMLGDYPKIYGDKCLLNIYHQDSEGLSNNNLEVHEYFFTFDCDTSEVLRNTVFENMRVINRGVDMDSTVVGSFMDYDIGGPFDDFVGTNVELGMVYAYNGDVYDATDLVLGFQQHPPAQGLMVLTGMKLSPNNDDNPTGVEINESINGIGFGDGNNDNEFYTLETSHYYSGASAGYMDDPENLSEFWNVLNGRYRDGNLRYFTPGVPIRYDFHGNSDSWFYGTRGYNHGNNTSESTSGNPPGDRRIVAGSGPGLFASGDTINYLVAHITSFDSTDVTFPIATDKLFADAQWLKTAFQTNDLGCGNTFGPIQNDLGLVEKEQYTVTIYPNPFNNELYISNLSSGLNTIEILNLEGKIVYETSSFGENSVLNLELLPGFYLISISNSLGNVVKRIVKN